MKLNELLSEKARMKIEKERECEREEKRKCEREEKEKKAYFAYLEEKLADKLSNYSELAKYFDYLKVLLSNPRIRSHVLYGSDYYMAEIADLTEKQVSLGLRSRLGEELYFQIAHYNPRRYLGLPRSGDWKKPRP